MSGLILPSSFGAAKAGNAVMAGDPYWSSVSLLLHFNGADESQTITDSGPNALAVTNSGVYLDSAQSRHGGTAARFTTGINGYLRFAATLPTELNILSSDWTIEFSVFRSEAAIKTIIGNLNNSTGSGDWWVNVGTTGGYTVEFGARGTGTTQLARFGTTGITTNTWNDVKLSRSGSTISCDLNGSKLGADITGWADRTAGSGNVLRIGSTSDGAYMGNMWIDELRVTKGVARDITGTWAPFPDFAA